MKRILIIEDDRVVASIYSSLFRAEGYSVEVAPDGQAGQDLAVSFKPDLVILDLMLPQISGVDVLKFIRAQPELKAAPVIVFSNLYLANQVSEAWKAGATKCLSKIDCQPRQLVQVVKNALATAAQPVVVTPPTPPPVEPSPISSPSPVAPPPAPAPPAAPPFETAQEDAFVAELRQEFLREGPQMLATMRGLLMSSTKCDNESQQLARLRELSLHARRLGGNAGIVGLVQMARLAEALEALLKELCEKPGRVHPSVLRTLAQTLDFFGTLFERSLAAGSGDLADANVLVVDDDIISRRAVIRSLDRAHLRSIGVADPLMALQLLNDNQFDLVVSDIEMPGMDGFELCAKLRALPHHATTPVVFVTTHADFDNRAKSVVSGGNDFIAKPFLFMELAVKVLTHVLRRRLRQGTPERPPPAFASSPAPPAAIGAPGLPLP